MLYRTLLLSALTLGWAQGSLARQQQLVFSLEEEEITLKLNAAQHNQQPASVVDALDAWPEEAEQVSAGTTPIHSKDTDDNDEGEWLAVAQHPAFPEYRLRIREPKLCDSTVKQYSGYLDVGQNKHFYFWFFASRHNPTGDPVILWLNGGPGCSSMTGLLMELGPCRVNDQGDGLLPNPHAWNNRANLIFLDQPMNVGYSHGQGVFNSVTASEDVYAFLQIFFQKFSEYAALPFHIFGESYGGHYVPAIGRKVFDMNLHLQDEFSALGHDLRVKGVGLINLESLGIGNGLVDELVQYKYYSTMACNSSYGSVLDKDACRRMDEGYPNCARLIQQCYDHQSALSCVPASVQCNSKIIRPYQESGLNPYDVREQCKGGQLCYPIIEAIEKFMNRPEVMKELGAEVNKFQGCNMNVNLGFQLAGDWMRPYMRMLPEMLDFGIRVLVYAGDADFICNWYGNKAWTLELPWSGKQAFNDAQDQSWQLADAKAAGEVRSVDNFTFLRVFEAGHMVPYDQPRASADMIERWISKKPFA
ncbi:hypothetical protein IWQ61_002087 [Dispira simplex]|nr:hypothetical protein IWQ61_002087 [Dispira simplex]